MILKLVICKEEIEIHNNIPAKTFSSNGIDAAWLRARLIKMLSPVRRPLTSVIV